MVEISIGQEPYFRLPYLNAGTRGRGAVWGVLPFFPGRIKGLPGNYQSLVWSSMAAAFGTVRGVSGNHDIFGEVAMQAETVSLPDGCLDGFVKESGNLRIGGVCGIEGKEKGFLQSRATGEFSRLLKDVLGEKPDILLLHSAPEVDERHFGSSTITSLLRQSRYGGLVICGHCHWPERIQRIDRATILNVHEAVVTLIV